MKPVHSWRDQWPTLLVLAIFVAVTLSASFLCDDAFITFRYAKNLAQGNGPVYNVGERVEGYTNFLWMLLMAAVIKLGGAPEFWSRLLSIAFSCATLLLLLNTGKRTQHGRPARLIFPIFLAVTAPFVVWSTGGLETAAAAFFVLASVVAAMSAQRDDSIRSAALAGALAASAILTRPDGAIVAAITGLWLFLGVVRRKLSLRTFVAYLLPLFALVGLQVIWRFNYYGHWLPNTFYVKNPALEFLPFGLRYLGQFVIESGLWFPLGAAAILVGRKQNRRIGQSALYLLLLFLVFSAWVVYTGGDFMSMSRFFVPILPVLYLILSELSLPSEPLGKRTLAAVAVILLAQVGYSGFVLADSRQLTGPEGLDSIGLVMKYRNDWTKTARLLRAEARPNDTIATGAAGIIPYYTDLYTLDLLGLTAPDLSGYRQRSDARRPGHSLSISPELFMKREPQFFLGTPTILPPDSGHFTWGSLPDAKEIIVDKYYAVSMSLPDDSRLLYFFLRKDLAPRYQGKITAYKLRL